MASLDQFMNISYTEENYLKAIYQQGKNEDKVVSTNALAVALHTSPAAVTDMIQRLSEKGLVDYKKYQGVNISAAGKILALRVIRKHLLWEVFLVEKLKIGWEEVHEIAEQLEHIQSLLLIQKLDDFLGNPVYGPHGESIPSAQGKIIRQASIVLTSLEEGRNGVVVAIKDDTVPFLQYLSKRNIYLGAQISVIEKIPFDQSMDISVDRSPRVNVSKKVSDNILIAS